MAKSDATPKGQEYEMPLQEAITEHERLVKVLRSPGHADDSREAEEQAEELARLEKVAKSIKDGLADMGHREPTPAQKKAGNYPMQHWKLHGLDISIENLAGTKRSGVDHTGKAWETVMPYHYGYIKRTEGADGDHLDCAIGPLHDQGTEAHIINQKGPKGAFDEHKVFIGYPSREAALNAFKAGHSRADEVFGGCLTVPIDELKRWVAEGCHTEPAVLKALEEVAKAEKRVKAHYRIVNGKVTYVHDYSLQTHGDLPQAQLHHRTIAGKHKTEGHYLRATDKEDSAAVQAKAKELGVEVSHVAQRGSSSHHGLQGSFPHVHFKSEEDAKKVHAALEGGAPAKSKGQDYHEAANAAHDASTKAKGTNTLEDHLAAASAHEKAANTKTGNGAEYDMVASQGHASDMVKHLQAAQQIKDAEKSGLPPHLQGLAKKMEASHTVTDVTPAGYGPGDGPALHVGDTKVENGKTFVLNENHHWELAIEQHPEEEGYQEAFGMPEPSGDPGKNWEPMEQELIGYGNEWKSDDGSKHRVYFKGLAQHNGGSYDGMEKGAKVWYDLKTGKWDSKNMSEATAAKVQLSIKKAAMKWGMENQIEMPDAAAQDEPTAPASEPTLPAGSLIGKHVAFDKLSPGMVLDAGDGTFVTITGHVGANVTIEESDKDGNVIPGGSMGKFPTNPETYKWALKKSTVVKDGNGESVIHVQGVGKMKAKAAQNFEPGDTMVWGQFGEYATIVSKKPSADGKKIEFTATKNGKPLVFNYKPTHPVAYTEQFKKKAEEPAPAEAPASLPSDLMKNAETALEGMPATASWLKLQPAALQDAIKAMLGNGFKQGDNTAATAVQALRKAMQWTDVQAASQTPMLVGALTALANELSKPSWTASNYMGGLPQSAKNEAIQAWHQAVDQVKTEAAARSKAVKMAADGAMGAGQDANAAHVAQNGYPSFAALKQQASAFKMYADLLEGEEDEQGRTAMMGHYDDTMAMAKNAWEVDHLVKADATEAYAAGMEFADKGENEAAKHQLMLAAMSFHYKAQAAKALGKTAEANQHTNYAAAAANKAKKL